MTRLRGREGDGGGLGEGGGDAIAAEAALDGLDVIRTSVTPDRLDAPRRGPRLRAAVGGEARLPGLQDERRDEPLAVGGAHGTVDLRGEGCGDGLAS